MISGKVNSYSTLTNTLDEKLTPRLQGIRGIQNIEETGYHRLSSCRRGEHTPLDSADVPVGGQTPPCKKKAPRDNSPGAR